jgi:tol-pal system protein YbgF
MRRMKFIFLLMTLGVSSLVYAVAPVVDAYEDDEDDDGPPPAATTHRHPSVATSNTAATFSLPQRVSILERQMSNLNPLSVTIDDLTQQLQTLQGKVEQQQFRLKQLEEQIRIQYQGLEKRLAEQKDKKAEVHAGMLERSSSPSSSDSLSTALHASPKKPSVDASSHTPVPTAASERAYQAAFQLLRSKQYPTAIEAFEAFIKKYPTDLNRANASYFLGQLYLLQAQPERAINQFNHFVNHYSQDARVPDALLQLGLAYFAKGDKTVAIDTFKKIIQKYPDTSAAESAKARIQQFEAMVSAANHLEKKKKT